jgi:hypothetical protein
MIPRQAQLEGRPHYVCPVVMGVAEQTWRGGNGPLYYPAEELEQSVQLWNGRPLVVYHPSMATNGCAGSPDVFNKQKVGHVFNAKFVGNKLKGEAWVDISRCRQVDPELLDRIESGEMIEVSTGLFTRNDRQPTGMVIARDHRPDHLAILPNQKGACSIAMGAGLNRNQQYVAPRLRPFIEEALPVPSLNGALMNREDR